MSIYTGDQLQSLRVGVHPDCCIADPCPFCGASEAVGGGGCDGQLSDLCRSLFMAAYRHDHNSDPSRVLHATVGTGPDAALFDQAARIIAKSALLAARTPEQDR